MRQERGKAERWSVLFAVGVPAPEPPEELAPPREQEHGWREFADGLCLRSHGGASEAAEQRQ